MKTTKLFFMAALALMTAACSNDDNDIAQQPAKAEGIPFTATISIGGDKASNRALSESGSTLVATWAVNDEVALIHNGVIDKVTVASVSGGVATISGTITSDTDGASVTVIYPYDAADGTTGNVKAGLLAAQDGTLATIAANYDVRKGTGTLKVSGTASLNGNVTLTNQNAIFKFTTKNSGGTATIDVNSLTVTIGSDNYVITPASATSELYVALPAVSSQTVSFSATGSDSKTYTCSKASVTFAAGKYYQSTLKMAPVTTLDNTTTAWTAGTYVVPASGKTYNDAITVSGNVTLVLTDGETLTLNKGISLASGATLTIEGNGTMNINGTNNSTASTVAGTGMLVLTSGTLNAKGGNGEGVYSEDNLNGGSGGTAINGSVTVSGGTLTAIGGNGGEGWFTSDIHNSYGGSGGTAITGSVTINSGTLTATGGNGGNLSCAEECSHLKAGNGGDAIGGSVTENGGTTTFANGSDGSASTGPDCSGCNAGSGGKSHN